MIKGSKIKFAAANLMAVVFAVCASGIGSMASITGAMNMMIAIVSPLLMAFLYGFCGIIPPAVMAACMLIGGFMYMGAPWAGALLIGGILPAGMMIYSSYKGFRFFTQVRNAIIIQFAAFLALLLSVYLMTGEDFSTLMIETFRSSIEMLTDEEKDLFVSLFREMLQFEENEAEALKTTEGFIATLLSNLEVMMQVGVPSSLILYSFANGAFGVLWMNWLRAKHEEENVQFVPLSGWRLSKEITLGLLIFYILSIILGRKVGDRAASAVMMISAAVSCGIYVQAGASILSRLKAAGMSRIKRTWLFIPLAVFGGVFITIYGILSALFGSKGLFTPKRLPGGDGMNQQDNNKEE